METINEQTQDSAFNEESPEKLKLELCELKKDEEFFLNDRDEEIGVELQVLSEEQMDLIRSAQNGRNELKSREGGDRFQYRSGQKDS
jgi:hypothetical protein